MKPQSSSASEGEPQKNAPVEESELPAETKAPTSSPAARLQLIDTSVEEPSKSTAVPGQPSEPSEAYRSQEAKLPEPLKKLVQAPHLYDLSKGGSSEFSDAFTQALALGPACRNDLQFVIDNGSPAGKIYAASLLLQFDRAAGLQILGGFKTDKTLVINKSYTASEHYTMGEVAIDLLSPRPSIVLRR